MEHMNLSRLNKNKAINRKRKGKSNKELKNTLPKIVQKKIINFFPTGTYQTLNIFKLTVSFGEQTLLKLLLAQY